MAAVNPLESLFYFYNPTTVAFGKVEFKKNLGNRNVSGNWRLSGTVNGSFGTNDSTAVATGSRGDKNNNVEQSTIVEDTTAFT
jgi:hypothetical protein